MDHNPQPARGSPRKVIPMLRKAILLCTVFGVASPGVAFAQPSPANAAAPLPIATAPAVPYDEPSRPAQCYSLADLESWAIAQNPALAEYAARVEAASGKKCQACLYPNPRLTYVANEIGAAGRAGLQGFGVSQEIVRGGKRRLDAAVAESEIAFAEHTLSTWRQRVLNDVRLEFYNTLASQQLVQRASELEKLGQKAAAVTEQLFKAQQISRADLLQAYVERDIASLALETARHRHVAAWRSLSAVVGMSEIALSPLNGNLDLLPDELQWTTAWHHLLANSPELWAAQANVEKTQWAVCRAQQETVPNLNVAASVQHDNSVGEDVTNLSVEFPFPIWNRNQGNIAAAQAEHQAALAQQRRIELGLYQRLAVAFQKYSQAQARVRKYNEAILPNSRQSFELVTKGYEQQEFSYLQLVIVQRAYYQANREQVEALLDLHAAAISIDGLLLSGSLDAP